MLNNLKLMLGIALEDTALDEKLLLIIENAIKRLKILLGGVDPPAELDHIVLEVAIIRFNRIGSEGLTSHSIEGESLSFSDNDFMGFTDEIQAWLDTQKEAGRGKLRFL